MKNTLSIPINNWTNPLNLKLFSRGLSMTRSGLLLTIVAFLAIPQAFANTVYISDELTVPLRSGPSGQHRIIHAGIPSGTQLTTIGENADAGFTQIRTQRGTEAWVRTQYLVSEPVAKLRLASAQREIAQLRQRIARSDERIKELTSASQSQASANQASSQEISQLKSELDRINAISSGALETHEENLQLKDVNARLRDELDDISEERNLLLDNAENESLMLGAGFILLGLIAGVLIKARPQRSAWS